MVDLKAEFPLHHDVLHTYSWSANVAGCKRWTLYPPSETPKLVRGDGKCPADFPPPAPGGVRRVAVVVQRAGELYSGDI